MVIKTINKMRKMNIALIFCMVTLYSSCDKELIEYQQSDLKVSIEQGNAYLHDFPLFLGIKKKNPPQIAIWIEDLQGNYISTIFATHKIATAKWQSASGNRRKESLPHWCYSRGVQYSDGLYLPTRDNPLTDGVSGATPTASFNMKIKPKRELKQFIIKIEVNHSTDFNDNYPKSAKEGDAGYSGGEEGSGQPAVVYAAKIDLTSQTAFRAELTGHSSPDGTDGNLQTDVSKLTSALDIVKQITINIQ